MNMRTYVYVSSWKKSSSDFGLSCYQFNSQTGELQFVEKVEKDVVFNVTCFDERRSLLYAVEEEENLPGVRGGGGGGRVFVFKVNPDTGTLTKVCCKETWCSSPAYLTLDATGEFLMVANHGSKAVVTKVGQDPFGNYYPIVEHDDSTVELFSVNEDGTIDRLLDVVKHVGSGPEKRQVIAHPHSTVMSPSGKLFAVCDKGNDTVRMYKIDREKGKLILPKHIYKHKEATLPRYCVFHPEKPWFYHNNENTTDFNAFTYDEDGFLSELCTCDTMPDDQQMKEKVLEQQDLSMDREGRYIYDIVRGPNVVAVLEVNQEDGSVKAIQYQPIPGKWPRGCTISPNGKFLLVCSLGSEQIIVYAIGADGRLTETGNVYPNAAAAYATFASFKSNEGMSPQKTDSASLCWGLGPLDLV